MQNHIRLIREQRGLTLENVAESLGCTKAQLSKLERGIIRLNDEWLDKLSYLYSCSVHALIDDDFPTQQLRLPEQNAFSTAKMVGFIDSNQAGIIDYVSASEQYPVHFVAPKTLEKFKKLNLSYTSYTVKGDAFPSYPDGSHLIFLNVDEALASLIGKNSVVICSQKDDGSSGTSESVRVIEYDDLGIPYAIFKRRKSRQHIQTLARDMLLGKLDGNQLLKILAEAEIDSHYKKMKKRPISIVNSTVNIKSILIKSVTDEI